MTILLMVINGYSIGGYWFLYEWALMVLMAIILVVIGVYYISGNCRLFVVILLMVIGGYFIDGY